uniref:Uncharacterized protein n=1 Tax=Rhizophora mucronata TaxID=61149 RepID=A0A2P2ISX1_RHIMU
MVGIKLHYPIKGELATKKVIKKRMTTRAPTPNTQRERETAPKRVQKTIGQERRRWHEKITYFSFCSRQMFVVFSCHPFPNAHMRSQEKLLSYLINDGIMSSF